MLPPRLLGRVSSIPLRLFSTYPPSLSSPSPSKLTLYTAPHCDLCHLMRLEIQKASALFPLQLETFNIRDSSLPNASVWRRKYQYDIPVLHLDGKEIFRHRLKAQDLVDVLRKARAEAQAEADLQTEATTERPPEA